MPVEFRDIPGQPLYVASSEGRVYRKGSNTPLVGKSVNGYRVLKLSLDGGVRKYSTANRLICLAFHGVPSDEKMEAAHLDSVRDNNVPSNLKWKTRSENALDCRGNGTHIRNPTGGKLAPEQVEAIRNLKGRTSLRKAAKDFDISPRTISNIWAGHSHKAPPPQERNTP